MKTLIAVLFRVLFKLPFMKKAYYGVYKRFFKPLNLFQGVSKEVYFHGFKLDLHLDDWIQQNIFFLGTYEGAELKVVEKLLSAGGTFADIGANVGLYSLTASRQVGPKGKVYSFEPMEKTYTLLKKNVSINKLDNVHTEKLAIGENSKPVALYYDSQEQNRGMASTRPVKGAFREEVSMVSLDEYVQSRPVTNIDLIKIDIEGGEYAALLGMQNSLTTFRPVIIIEILDYTSHTCNATRIHNFFYGLGYKKFFIDNSGNLIEHQSCSQRKNYVFVPSGWRFANKP